MRFKKLKLQPRITLFIVALIMIILIQISLLLYYMLSRTTEQQLGEQALNVAETVATMPEVRAAFRTEKPWEQLQPLVERIRIETTAEFIVIGNKEGIRYSHPNPDRIGEKMVGGDNELALENGVSYISKATGTLGLSLRGKAPIRDEDGTIIGIVSVGFLMKNIYEIAHDYGKLIVWIAASGLLMGTVGSIYLARNIKNLMFGFEPEEISKLYEEHRAIIQSVREGIMVTDKTGKISLVNQTAAEILSLDRWDTVIGKHVLEIVPTTSIMDVLHTGERQLDKQLYLGDKIVIANRVPVKQGDEVIGVVSSFRLKSEIDQLTEELSQVKRYTEALRAQTHEFNNLLYTLSGLIQLGSYEEALELVHKETAVQHDFTQFIMKRLRNPWLGGILIGFYNRARELKIDFVFDRESSLDKLPPYIDSSHVVSILGNLITNAFESVEKNDVYNRKVRLFVTDMGNDILIEVEDSGPGIDDRLLPHIFQRGFSTKATNQRGYGLAKVKELVKELNGTVAIERGDWNGALFIIAIPKERNEAHATSY
ncbi:sensor histidine kinase [Ectobacillus sp. JY-23]|uniref:ATP-binding protein n=1 Tax=Ectobacillus sp. JY-23 TaxID=2933872 RepID=UPI001FF0DF84|nr:sensor histidine kinase [Ectobacillus sp. JY-23]UOY91755.1 sensor histidine kinase [Ectobacillus sp. JY-23]